MDTEAIRSTFRPNNIRLLMIGESPPAGGKFFYVKSAMTGYMARAFETAHRRKFSSKDQVEFLEYFKKCGCYLDDACHYPIDKLDTEDRAQVLAECVSALGKRLKNYQPDAIAVVLKKVEPHVRIAIVQADIRCQLYILPFPGYGHQRKFIQKMEEIIERHVPRAT